MAGCAASVFLLQHILQCMTVLNCITSLNYTFERDLRLANFQHSAAQEAPGQDAFLRVQAQPLSRWSRMASIPLQAPDMHCRL